TLFRPPVTAGREPTGTTVPVRQDQALLDDIRAFDDDSAFALWWPGQSGFLLKWRGRHLLIDPYLSDSLTRKYPGTGRGHVRLTARCVAPAHLDMVDAAASSHLHTDHLDAATLGPVAQAVRTRTGSPLPLVVPEGILDEARNRLDGHPVAFVPGDAGRTVKAAGF